MKAIELFAGVGGFRLGLERNKIEVVYANEWDKYAADIYDKNFGGTIDRRSITDVQAADIPKHDIICGGFPCQAFSIAGKRRGFDETRGTLFFEIMRIARHHRTPYLFLENVKGLLNHDKGRTFETILRTLDELGYDCQWQVLNSKDFGVPQNRERVFIIGHLRGQPRPQVFPLSPDSKTDIVLPTLTARYYGAQATGGYIGGKNGNSRGEIEQPNQPVHSNDRVYGDSGIAPTLNTMQAGNRQPFVTRQPLRFLDRNQKNVEGDYAFTVDSSNTSGVKVLDRIRRLTPLECERLQGFPDGWTELGLSSIMEICASINPAIEKLLPKSATAYSITSDGRNMEVRICPNGSNQPVFAVEGLVPETFVTDTTKAGNATVTHYSPNEISSTVEPTKPSDTSVKTEGKSTSRLWSVVLDANLPKEKLSTTLTSIHATMKSPIFTSAQTAENITGYIIHSNLSLPSYTNEVKLSFQTGSIIPTSDTQRYKIMGNAVTVNVIEAIARKLL